MTDGTPAGAPKVGPPRQRSGGSADVARFATMGVTGIATFGLVGYFGLTERTDPVELPPTSVAPAPAPNPTPTEPTVPTPTTAVPLSTLLPATTAPIAPTTIPATSPPPPPVTVPPPPPPVDVVSRQSQ
jgi:hypothetical protein